MSTTPRIELARQRIVMARERLYMRHGSTSLAYAGAYAISGAIYRAWRADPARDDEGARAIAEGCGRVADVAADGDARAVVRELHRVRRALHALQLATVEQCANKERAGDAANVPALEVDRGDAQTEG